MGNQVQIFINLILTIMKTIKRGTNLDNVIRNGNFCIPEKLQNGDIRYYFNKRFVYTNGHWSLDEVCHNVISPKNVENSGYRIHSYSL
jgi:hypothetical protein